MDMDDAGGCCMRRLRMQTPVPFPPRRLLALPSLHFRQLHNGTHVRTFIAPQGTGRFVQAHTRGLIGNRVDSVRVEEEWWCIRIVVVVRRWRHSGDMKIYGQLTAREHIVRVPRPLCGTCIRIFEFGKGVGHANGQDCLLYTSPSPRDLSTSRMPSSA